MRPDRNLLCLVLLLGAAAAAQTVQITGKVLEKAAMRPVPGAVVTWKSAGGATLTRTADSAGNFTLNGTPSALAAPRVEWANGPLVRNGKLQLRTSVPGIMVRSELFDSQGRLLTRASRRLEEPGFHEVPVPGPEGGYMGFLKVDAGGETYRLRVAHAGGPAPRSQAAFVSPPGALAKAAATGDTLIVTMDGLVSYKLPNPPNSGTIADIVMDYPPRTSIGVGARRPYGAIVLFDGTQGSAAGLAEMHANWVDWRDWPNGCQSNSAGSTKNTSPAQFRIAKDPEFPNDTNRVTLRTHFATGTISRWGCDDIEARPELHKHGDVQIHVEWIAMGEYNASNPEDPDTNSTCSPSATTAACWVNSGVYVQNRYEIQIQSVQNGVNITDCHYMGSVVNEYAPSATQGLGTGNSCATGGNTVQSPCPDCGPGNQFQGNGKWNAYDITFRTARYNGATKTADAYLSMWWNGVLVHQNRRIQGLATGVNNTSGEAIDSVLYGIKLQRERGDVRFRNVWYKHLKIDSTNTTFGY